MRLKTFCELVIISTVFWLEASPPDCNGILVNSEK